MFPSQRLSELAESVADGATPDWESAESSAPDACARETVARLHAVASIGRFFATLSSRARADRSNRPVLPAGSMWGALRVIEHVGCGRFGDVYRAWDAALDREVALKILRADDDNAVQTDIVEEGRLMARVRHPNVVAIHGARRIDGATGLWMEFVKGRTLAAELAELGPLGAEELARIGIQLCCALTAVHAAGLVHRDVKAQNVLRDDTGRVVLGDFGTGRQLEDSAPSSGSLAGTPTYVAPELFAGAPVTPHSDLYSLGVLLFHLATRAYPVEGRSLRDLRDAHASGRRTALGSLRPDLPKRLARAIEKALDPYPTHRYESAELMAQALESCVPGTASKQRSRAQLAGVAAMLVLSAAVSAFTWQVGRRAPAAIPFAERDWVLVTDFENLTGDPSLDGALEYALERELSNSSFVNVVPRSRIDDALELMRKPAGTRVDANVGREVALRDGRIKAMIVGRVEKTGDAYTVSAQIASTADGATAAIVNEVSVDSKDLVRVVGRMAVGLRQKLGEALPRIKTDPEKLEKVATPSMRALQLYSQARALAGDVDLFAGPTIAASVEQLLTDALAEDPSFVWAHILMAHALWVQERSVEALTHVERAVAATEPGGIDRYIATGELHAFRGILSGHAADRNRHLEQAMASFEAALQLQPDHAWSMGCLMNLAEMLGRFPGSVFIERYLAVRPNSVVVFAQAMNAAIAYGNLTLARDYARRGSALDVPIDSMSNAAANLRIFAVRDAFYRRNPRQALLEADRLAGDPRSRARTVVMQIGLKLAEMYVALGRLDRVEQVASWIEPQSSGHRLLVVASAAREDRDALRVLLRRLFPNLEHVLGGSGGLAASATSAFISAGLLDSAHRLIAKRTHGPTFHMLLEGELALAQGRVPHGVGLLERLLREDAPAEAWMRTRGSLVLADFLTARGEVSRAVGVLETASQERRHLFEDLKPEHLRVRERLAQLYRQLDRIAEAEGIEADLRRLLAVAEDDHPMKLRLERIPASAAPVGQLHAVTEKPRPPA
jgi:tetratricopeptide (TPR) repeat protein